MALRLDHAARNINGEYHLAYWGWPDAIPLGGHHDIPVTFTNDGASSVTWQGPNGSGSYNGFDYDKFEFAACPATGTVIPSGATVQATIRCYHNATGTSWSNSIYLTYRASGVTYTIYGSLFNEWPGEFVIAAGDNLFTGPPTYPVQVDGLGDPIPLSSITVDDQAEPPDYGLLSFLASPPEDELVGLPRVRFTRGIDRDFQLTDDLDPSTYPGATLAGYSGAASPTYSPFLSEAARWSYGVPTRVRPPGTPPSITGSRTWWQVAGVRVTSTGSGVPTAIVAREYYFPAVSLSGSGSSGGPYYYLSFAHRDHVLLINSTRAGGIYMDGRLHLS